MIIIFMTLFLSACSTETLEGTWIAKEGLTEITFEEDRIQFFGIQGTYNLSEDKLILDLEGTTLIYPYKLSKDYLFIWLEDSELILIRENSKK